MQSRVMAPLRHVVLRRLREQEAPKGKGKKKDKESGGDAYAKRVRTDVGAILAVRRLT